MSDLVTVLSDPFISLDIIERTYKSVFTHYTAILPFLEQSTLIFHYRKRLEPTNGRRETKVADCNLVLIAVLALACNSDPDLCRLATQHVLRMGSLETPPKYYSDLVLKNLNINLEMVASWEPDSLEQLQAFLVLAVVDWQTAEKGNTSRRTTEWISQGMGLRKALSLMHRYDSPGNARTREERTTRQVRVRTVFSTFIFDRFINASPADNNPVELGILPLAKCSSENIFEPEDPALTGPSAVGEGVNAVLIWHLRMVDIFSEVSWFCGQSPTIRNNSFSPEFVAGTSPASGSSAGTLRSPPPDTPENRAYPRFLILVAKLDKFAERYPEHWSLEYDARALAIIRETYIIRNLCRLMLFRDRVPLIPMDHLVRPAMPDSAHAVHDPDTFTLAAARETYTAAKNVMSVICGIYEDNKGRTIHTVPIPLSPIMPTALWQALFSALHAHHFPHLDVTHAVLPSDYEIGLNYGLTYNPRIQGMSGQAFSLISLMARHWKPACRFLQYFRWSSSFFHTWRLSFIRYLLSRPQEEPQQLPDMLLLHMQSANFNSGFAEWEELRTPLLGIGYHVNDASLEDFTFTSPVMATFGMPGQFLALPNFDNKGNDTDMINAWVLLSAFSSSWTPRLNVVSNLWHQSPFKQALFSAPLFREGDLAAWHPLRVRYPATRMWRWNEEFPMDEKFPNLENKWRRVLEVEMEMDRCQFDFPQHIHLATNIGKTTSVTWLPPRREVQEWDMEKQRMGAIKHVRTLPFPSWRREKSKAPVLPAFKFIPTRYLKTMAFRSTDFDARVLVTESGFLGFDAATWNIRLSLSHLARAMPTKTYIIAPVPRPTPSLPNPHPHPSPHPHPYGAMMQTNDLSNAPTPGNTIPMPVYGHGGGLHIDGFYYNQISGPHSYATAANRVAKGRPQSRRNTRITSVLTQPLPSKFDGQTGVNSTLHVQPQANQNSREQHNGLLPLASSNTQVFSARNDDDSAGIGSSTGGGGLQLHGPA